MKKLSKLILLLIGLSGCAGRTVHEICSDSDIVSHYKTYDQCYAEESAAKERKFIAVQDAMRDSDTNKTVSRCTLQKNLYSRISTVQCE